MNTKTIISGSGKNIEGMEWSNLLAGYCPKCDSDLHEDGGYWFCDNTPDKCDFCISKKRFSEICEETDGGNSYDDKMDDIEEMKNS